MPREELKKEIKKEVLRLYNRGADLLTDELEKKGESVPQREGKKPKGKTNLHMDYQPWYSTALPLVRQILPERHQEFAEQYKIEKRKEIDFVTYTISDYLVGLKVTRGHEEIVNAVAAFSSKFQLQLTILFSALERIDSILADLEGVLQADLFQGELRAAEELLKKKHLRAAGALAGVTLEAHLAQICTNHKIKFRKKSPTISDYNDALKGNGVADVPTWRHIQRLGDIRNLCVHSKDRDPRKDEIEDLIVGVEKVTSTLF